MCIEKFIVRATVVSAASIVLLTAQPLCAESSSDTARIEKLERAVEQLQKQNGALEQRNAELEQKIGVLETHRIRARLGCNKRKTKDCVCTRCQIQNESGL